MNSPTTFNFRSLCTLHYASAMKDQLNNVLNFFYVEQCATSAYNNRFIFGIPENEFYLLINILEENKLIQAVGIRHSIPGYNLYIITWLGREFAEAGGFKETG